MAGTDALAPTVGAPGGAVDAAPPLVPEVGVTGPERSYAGRVGVVAALMIAGSFLVLAVEDAGAYAITGLVWGAILLALILWFRAQWNARRIRHVERMERLANERRRIELVERIAARGLPDGISLDDLRELLELDAEKEAEPR